MKFSEDFVISIAVNTTNGPRILSYTADEIDPPATDSEIYRGLGDSSKNGTWRTYIIDLGYDLRDAEPGNSIVELLGFYVSGNGRVDNIQSHDKTPDDLDSDDDGISDNKEKDLYGSNPHYPDTDNDGYDDGLEISQGTNPVDSASHP
jgi:hypothetical protein